MEHGRSAQPIRARRQERRQERKQRGAKNRAPASSKESAPFFDNPTRLDAFRNGDQTVLGAIYAHYAETVSTHVLLLARSTGILEFAQPSAIADILQEVFARAFSPRARRAYDAKRPFVPYLHAIARNCFVDALRRRRRELNLEIQDPLEVDQTPPNSNDDFETALLLIVDTYVSELAPPLREVYEQRFVAGLSQEAACKVLGISRRTLRTAEMHLKRGLRSALLREDRTTSFPEQSRPR